MNQSLNDLAVEYWEYVLRTNPTEALMMGDHRYDAEFEDASRAGEDADIAARRDFAARATAVDPASLTADEKITREVLIFLTEKDADLKEMRTAEWEVSHTMGMQAMLPVMVPQLPLLEPEHAEAMIPKMQGLARALREVAARLRDGVAAGKTPMRSTAEKSVTQVDGMLAVPPAENPLGRFTGPQKWAGESAWRDQIARTLEVDVLPALKEWRDTVANTVVPQGRPEDRPGLCHLPDGTETYRRAVAYYTTTDKTPEEIHQIGLEQIAKLADEYRRLGKEVLGTTDLGEIYSRLRDDPSLHFSDGPSVVAASEKALAKAKAAMGSWFGRLPKADCVVAETPTGPTAFYFRPAADGSRPGTFFVNTADPTRWGRYEIEAMAYHEGIPGHHLQLSIAGELEDGIPEFRKRAYIAAYGEGWGLYTERLADEMGLYSGPLEQIGMLSADSMRAGRLVIDTGLHAMGWTRQQAIDYFRNNSPMSQGTIEGEVDRYIAMPAQALSYMIGRLEIMRMRAEAEKRLGDRFDIKGFHDTVLGSGLVPLSTLDRMVREWAAA
ncbi:MAG TPA: DUF885 domain-containing protein [Acidimicrobiia bacterium]|nr:DUF885 domain-containing protein [Acidimicrobiia bacterium]